MGYGAYPYAAYGAYPYAYGYFGGLQAHPNGAVTPVDEPAVQAAKADHFAAKAAAYPAAPIAIAKREAEPAYYGGYRSYGYGRRYGGYGYRSYGYGKRSAEPGYGYRSYGYGRRYGGYGYRSYGYGY